MEQLELTYIAYGNVERFNYYEKQFGNFFIVTHSTKEPESYSYLYKRNKKYIAPKNLKQAKCPSSRELINCGILFIGILFIN